MRLAVSVLALATMAACATSSGPVVVGGASRTDVGTPPEVDRSGYIGQCHDGLALARITYPSGWDARLKAAEYKPSAEDELLGGAASAPKKSELSPVRQPTPSFPVAALSDNREGACQVMFDIAPGSETPTNVVAACSDASFVSSAEAAVSAARFRAEGGRKANIYPLLYCFE